MNLKNKRPVFVTLEFYDEIERLSKAALMDMVWDYAAANRRNRRRGGNNGRIPQAARNRHELSQRPIG